MTAFINDFTFKIHTLQNQLNNAQHELAISMEHQQNNLLVLAKQSQIQPSEESQLLSPK